MKVLVSVFSNLYTDQRIEKVCQTLYHNGYSVSLIGNDWGGEGAMERPYFFSRIKLKSKILKLAYPEFNWKLYHELKKYADKDTILLANDLDALLPNVLIAQKLNIPLIFDSHEIYTEMPVLKGRFTQKIWKYLERKLLPKIHYMMTASFSYAEWFKKEYGLEPTVVRNFPQRILKPISIPSNDIKIILYQGAINPYRGISQTIMAMHHLENAIFLIAGDGPKKQEYETLVKNENLSEKVKFLGKLHPTELREVTKNADVGLSVEENEGLSYFYSLPNKVSDYIQSKVPLVMINFPEMMKIYQSFKVGEIIENHHPETIAEKIKIVLENGRNYYLPELKKASEVLCWEKEESKILDLFKKAIQEHH